MKFGLHGLQVFANSQLQMVVYISLADEMTPGLITVLFTSVDDAMLAKNCL